MTWIGRITGRQSDIKGNNVLIEYGDGDIPPPATISRLEGRKKKEERHTQFSLRIEWVDKKKLVRSDAVLYGLLFGAQLYVSGQGIQLLFEGAYAEELDGWRHGD